MSSYQTFYRFTISKEDLENHEQHEEFLKDYPMYMSTSGLTRAEIVLLDMLMKDTKYEDDEYEVTIKKKEK